MMNFCHDSDAMWKIMNVTMPNAGVHPTIEQWMAYSVRLSIEGDTKRKKEVTAIIEEMARTENYAFNDMDTLPIRELRSEKINSLLGLGSDGVVAAGFVVVVVVAAAGVVSGPGTTPPMGRPPDPPIV